MKILFLLFPLILLLVQGAAGNSSACRRRGGFCTFGRCRYPTTPVGSCSALKVCCKSLLG
uniref:Beta-defensin-like domain-containing protein n=1 Tax=Ficedula albicollis TaxID=59894 RepID=A0A803V1Z9_FICAL